MSGPPSASDRFSDRVARRRSPPSRESPDRSGRRNRCDVHAAERDDRQSQAAADQQLPAAAGPSARRPDASGSDRPARRTAHPPRRALPAIACAREWAGQVRRPRRVRGHSHARLPHHGRAARSPARSAPELARAPRVQPLEQCAPRPLGLSHDGGRRCPRRAAALRSPRTALAHPLVGHQPESVGAGHRLAVGHRPAYSAADAPRRPRDQPRNPPCRGARSDRPRRPSCRAQAGSRDPDRRLQDARPPKRSRR